MQRLASLAEPGSSPAQSPRLRDGYRCAQPHRAQADFFAGAGPAATELAKARRWSMKRCTTGFNVRFLSVMISTGHGRTGRSTGNIFSENRSLLTVMKDRG